MQSDDTNNISSSVSSKIGRNLHLQKYHPIEIIKHKIYEYFGSEFKTYDDLDPRVSVVDNFDKLLIPTHHPTRSRSDTYYLDKHTVLRTHTSAHQHQLLSKGITKFLVTGDVYRKDEVDKNHYPVFHQMEGLCIVDPEVDPDIELQLILKGFVEHLFPGCQYRINPDYFPFTNPSYEVEVEFRNKWLEILGCGVIQPKILTDCGLENRTGWAFGLGLERLAMILFDIPDIRLFWSNDLQFLSQFTSYNIVKYKPYSKLSPKIHDISFWITSNMDSDVWSNENDFYEICREIGGDMIEHVELFDKFYHSARGHYSRSYHIIYSPPNTTISNPAELKRLSSELHNKICMTVAASLSIIIR